MIYLVEMLLPQYDAQGRRFDSSYFEQVNRELTERFGGVTAFLRASAQGLWKRDDGTLVRDELASFEVMTDHLDSDWWGLFRQKLETRFQQDEIVIRVTQIQRI